MYHCLLQGLEIDEVTLDHVLQTHLVFLILVIAFVERIEIFSILYTGINIFLDGFVPTENLRFREVSLTFKVAETALEEEIKRMCRYEYPNMRKLMGTFF